MIYAGTLADVRWMTYPVDFKKNIKIKSYLLWGIVLIFSGVPSWSQKVIPTLNAGRHTLDVAGDVLQVVNGRGGRVVSLRHAGREVLYLDSGGNNNNWGSTFWPSPQDGWSAGTWPPPAALDPNTYTGGVVANDTTIVLTSGIDNGNNLRFRKTFWGNSGDTSFNARYTMINTSTNRSINWAPWEVTRFPAGGLTFYPTGLGQKTGRLASLTADVLGVTWFDYDFSTVPTSGNPTPKLFADGSEGWLAHINEDRVLILKKFEDTPPSQKAPDPENEIELYTDPTHSFQEVEQQGPYSSIPAGDSVVWDVKWYVRTVPNGIAIDANSNVIDFVNQVVNTSTAVRHQADQRPLKLRAWSNRAELTLENNSLISLSLIDLNGKELNRIHSGKLPAGKHVFFLDFSRQPRGVYYLILRYNGKTMTSYTTAVRHLNPL